MAHLKLASDRGYSAVCFEYKMASARYLVAEQNGFGCFWKKWKHPEAVLYAKRTAEYPLSPRIKTIVVAFLQAEL